MHWYASASQSEASTARVRTKVLFSVYARFYDRIRDVALVPRLRLKYHGKANSVPHIGSGSCSMTAPHAS